MNYMKISNYFKKMPEQFKNIKPMNMDTANEVLRILEFLKTKNLLHDPKKVEIYFRACTLIVLCVRTRSVCKNLFAKTARTR